MLVFCYSLDGGSAEWQEQLCVGASRTSVLGSPARNLMSMTYLKYDMPEALSMNT